MKASSPLPRGTRIFGAVVALCLGLATATPALAQAPAASEAAASPVLVDHLVAQLVKREQPAPTGIFGSPAAAADPLAARRAEAQLRNLGIRAAVAAPRVAELLMRSDKNAYDLAWTLWAVTPPAPQEEWPALEQAARESSGSERLLVIARLGKRRTPEAIAGFQEWARDEDTRVRLMAALALGMAGGTPQGGSAAQTLGTLLADVQRPVRAMAVNGLRLLGPHAAQASQALITYLSTRDNPYGAARAMAALPLKDLIVAKPELEGFLADQRFTDFQKQPAVELLMRIDALAAAGAPRALPPGTMPTNPGQTLDAPVERARPGLPGTAI